MIHIFICEDHPLQRQILTKNISFAIDENNYPMKIIKSTDNPFEILSYIKKENSLNIYFLDIDLNHSINGIDLAAKIREIDKFGKIIFITSHDEYLLETYNKHIEAFDYIIKTTSESTESDVNRMLQLVYSKFRDNKKEVFKVEIGSNIQFLPIEDILFFVTTPIPHKINLHLKNRELSFYGSLSKILKDHPRFIRCHRSYLVNIDNISSIDKKQRVLIMNNGETCLCSYLGMKKISALFI